VRGEGRWKNLEAWFSAMETRPTFVNIRSDHYTHVHDLPPQLGGKHQARAGIAVNYKQMVIQIPG
jgi:hypothetical protein